MVDPVLKVFIYATAVAVILQMLILLVLVISLRKTSARLEALAGQIHGRTMPILEATQAMVTDSRGKLEVITANLAATTTTLKNQMERLDVTINDIVDRTRLQVIRTDDIVTRTLDRVEETTDLVQHTVVSPVRQLSGIVQGLAVGINAFLGRQPRRRRRHNGSRAPQDEELFI